MAMVLNVDLMMIEYLRITNIIAANINLEKTVSFSGCLFSDQ